MELASKAANSFYVVSYNNWFDGKNKTVLSSYYTPDFELITVQLNVDHFTYPKSFSLIVANIYIPPHEDTNAALSEL